MKFKNTALLLTAALSLGLAIQSCGKKEDPPVTAKTLDKAKLIGKKWYNKGGSDIQDFKSNGTFGIDGTWKWVNNSDTMEIIPAAGLSKEIWKYYWSSDHEMACNLVGDPGEILYKDYSW